MLDVHEILLQQLLKPSPLVLGNLNVPEVSTSRKRVEQETSEIISTGRRPRSLHSRGPLIPVDPVIQTIKQTTEHALTREEEQTYCRILQEAKKLNALKIQLSRTLGRPATMQQLCEAAEGNGLASREGSEGSSKYVEFVLSSAPDAHRALFLGCKSYIASQARAILGKNGGASIVGACSEPGRKTPSGRSAGGGGPGVVQMDDLFLAGVQGLMQAAYRYDPTKSRYAASEASSPGRSSSNKAYDGVGGLRFLTYAHSYIHKHMMAAIKDSVYNQVFIPRRTLDLKRSVEKATHALRLERRSGEAVSSVTEEPSTADVAKRLGVTERAVQGVHTVWRTKHSSLDPGGAEDNPYEDVQLAKQMDKINSADLDASGSSLRSAASVAVMAAANGGDNVEGLCALGTDAMGYASTEVAFQRLNSLLGCVMKEREALVLCRSMGLGRDGGEGISAYSIAEEMGMSRQGVDRLRHKALERLRRACQEDPQLAQTLEEVCMELGRIQD